MNVIDKVKKLLTAAEKPCAECAQAVQRDMAIERCGHQVYAELKLKSLTIPLAQALVESQVALEEVMGQVGGFLPHKMEREARDALRLDRLAKGMKQETPRS